MSGDAAQVPLPATASLSHLPSPSPRFVRLTHLQWENAIQDLFYLPEATGLSSTFISDPPVVGFSTDVQALSVSPELWLDYQRVAEDLAQFVARDQERLEAILPEAALGNSESTSCFEAADIDELEPCCDGRGKCVPAFMLPASLHTQMESCDEGRLCVPSLAIQDVQQQGVYTPQECTSMAGAEGVCLSTCFPSVALFASFIPQDVCREKELCAPCTDPLTGEDSGACGVILNCPIGGTSIQEFESRRDAFLDHFGRRIFRRPLSADEVARYAEIFDRGVATLTSPSPFAAGVEFALRGMLQSPHFLYRVELSQTLDESGAVTLTSWELASRLSFTLLSSTPSDALLDAAAAGELDDKEGLWSWIQLLLSDARSREMVRDFHRQLLHTEGYVDLQKDPMRFPTIDGETGRHMQTEFDLFVEDVVFGAGEAGLTALLTSSYTFVNDQLAPLYGLDAADFDDDFRRVSLDPAERSGLLTRLGFLSDRASLREPDPILRGALVAERIICAELPPPPPNVQGLPVASAPTNRERVELHTGEGTCGEGCHSTMINPAGFPFEHYDAVGRYRTEDNGFPVNAADSYVLDGESVDYLDALGFSQVLAESLQVHACYVGHWLQYLYGRAHTEHDEAVLEALAEASLRGEASIEDLVAALLISDGFLTRSAEELAAPEVTP